ncbi:MAG: hypothetical protein ACRDRK_08045 [Pseudonocardia sp.]
MTTPLPPEWNSWLQEAQRLAAAAPLRRNEMSTRGPQDPKFALGDFLTTVPEAHLESLAKAVGEDPGQFRSYRDVASTLPPAVRVKASWSVHRNLRHRPELLRDGLTVRQANKLVGGKPIDEKPDSRRPVDERAAQVRAALADPDVFAVIDTELAAGRNARKVRGMARRVVSEHNARGRELEAELRALQQAKSPYEATVRAELDLNKATQLVHAVGASLEDLPQAERLVAALKELSVEVASVLAAAEPSHDPEAPFVVNGEVWQDRPARAALIRSNQEFLSGDGRVVVDVVDDDPP